MSDCTHFLTGILAPHLLIVKSLLYFILKGREDYRIRILYQMGGDTGGLERQLEIIKKGCTTLNLPW